MKVKDIIKHIERWCPKALAEEWDNVGLMVGDREQNVRKILVALDATDDVIDEAIEKNVDLIITHHPFIMNGIKRVTADTPTGRNIHKLIKNNISVYSAHTNLDSAKGGINDLLVEILELKNADGFNDNYNNKGIGRVGELDKEVSLTVFADKVRDILKLREVRVVGDLDQMVRKVAVCGGSGMSLIHEAVSTGADVYITGDVKYHNAQEALALGINVIDAGHYGTENIIVHKMRKYIEKLHGPAVIESNIDGNPFKVI